MKKLYATLIALFLICFTVLSQTGFSYQGVFRDKVSGKLRTNEEIELTAKLIQNGIEVYTESHKVKTNAYGVFSIIIGKGSNSKPIFTPLFFITPDSTSVKETHLLVTEGKDVISDTQILGVPFAEVAKVALKAQIDFPAGTIVAFGGDRIPSGWLLCDGKEYNKNDYYNLYQAIDVFWGGSGNLFRVPDLRGMFLRGVNHDNDDNGRTNKIYFDPEAAGRGSKHTGGNIGNKVGSYQNDTLVSHGHDILYNHDKRGVGNGTLWCLVSQGTQTTVKTEKAGVKETRPVNAYVNYIIKY